MTEIFVCKTAYPKDRTTRAISTATANLGKPGWENWEACGFTTNDEETARAHVALATGSLNCWVESHEDGDTDKPILREMHGSDYGGVYVQDYR